MSIERTRKTKSVLKTVIDYEPTTIKDFIECLSKYDADSRLRFTYQKITFEIFEQVPETDREMNKRISRELAYTKAKQPPLSNN